ncbi:MAG: hypothetical protein HY711_00390 [Candidatus Melainabacteria bacterium]|nr:hypothetical protein [Candidatus Melainabacteria bacterium]
MQTVLSAKHHQTKELAHGNSRIAYSQAKYKGTLQHSQFKPYLVPTRKSRTTPLIVRVNYVLRTTLVALCGLAILGYGLDVAVSNDVGRLQEQARRLSEQNTELSAQLLRVISFQGIQDSVLGRFGLRVPDKVLIAKEIQPYPLTAFTPQKHHLPLLAGY